MEPPPDCSPFYLKSDDFSSSISHSSLKNDQNAKARDNGDFLDLSAKTGHFGSTKAGVLQPSARRLLSKVDRTSSVRSSAVIAYSATKNNAMFSHLAPDTNLNLAPSNWLRKTVGLRPETVLPGSRYSGNPNRSFSGFTMASGHLDSIGKVDIVSDAENIKKLLKMPYNKAHVSMAIHRIGRTLLLENFDIKRFTAEESEWEWFRNFYQELVQQQQGSNTLFNKKKSPSSQYDRLMLSKFLYYSIYKESLNKIENKSQENKSFPGAEDDFHKNKDSNESNVKLIELDEAFAKESMTSVENEDKIKELSSSLSSCASSTIPDDKSDQSNDEETKGNNSIIPSDRRWRYWTPHDSIPTPDSTDAFERNISWTFEDLQMLLGTNMPIFGGGRYPAVSLRLRDSNKPINILTGIDYWLDNLICNVPELVMCFHVNGIVQNYEVIKTEDIPKLEHSSFSPQVVKDIAQNILSFLKSNCTKEGHTYWLFKGSGDDVVKLYDLTTLCHTTTSDIEANRRNLQKNPYIFSVAMLLYKTAISLMQSRDTCDHRITVKKLLIQCIDLLDRTKYQYVVSSAICMLSTLYLPDPNLDRPAKEGTTTKEQDTSSPGTTGSSDLKACDTCSAHHDADVADKRKNSEGPRNAEVASIPRVTDLSIPERYQPISASFDLIKSPQSRARRRDNDEENGQVEESCNTVLSYVVSGMECLVPCYRLEWQQSLLCQLIRNAALAYFRLAEQASNLGKLGRALRRSKLALQSYETFDYLSGDIWSPNSNNTERRPPDFHLLLPRMLSLCGEIQFALVQDIKSHGAVSMSHREELTSFTEDDEKIKTGLTTVLSADGKFSHLTQMSSEIDQALLNCSRCYEMALDVMEEFGPINKDGSMGDSNKNSSKSGKEGRSKGKGRSKRNAEPPSQATPTPSPTPENEEYPTSPTQRQAELIWALRTVLTRRHGHVVNELGASSLNRVVTLLSNDSSVTVKGSANHKIWDAWNEAKTHFEAAHKSFAQVNDAVNEALVLSNMGRLMRVSAQFYANNEQGQLSQQERQCFTTAIEKYQKALSLLGPKDPKRGCPVRVDTGASTCTTVYDNISWELSSSYFNMAQILQENAPEERQASEEAEKEVISLMNNSLKYCKDIWDKTAKQSVALYRQSKIYYRMASLHHNAYRSCTDIHKCKQLRNLAEKQYAKSLAILEVLDEHPYEMLRVQLERMALKEQHISSLNSLSQKMKLLFEGLYAVLECMKPLQRIEKSTKLATEDSFSSQVDSREQSSNTELDPSNVSEILGLLRILATILQSFLLLIVKFMKITGYEHESSLIRRRNQPVKSSQQSFKELYSRTLRSLQRVNVSEDEESNIDGIEGKYLVLQENVTTMINVLKDVENVLGK